MYKSHAGGVFQNQNNPLKTLHRRQRIWDQQDPRSPDMFLHRGQCPNNRYSQHIGYQKYTRFR